MRREREKNSPSRSSLTETVAIPTLQPRPDPTDPPLPIARRWTLVVPRSIGQTKRTNETNKRRPDHPAALLPQPSPSHPPGELVTPPPLSISNSGAPVHRPRLIEAANVQSTPASWLAGRGIGTTATRAVPPTPRLCIPRSFALVRRTLLLLLCEWPPPPQEMADRRASG